MAGGWGASVQAPMEVPQETFNRYLAADMPEDRVLPMELPPIEDASTTASRIETKAMPPMRGGDISTKARMEEAAALAQGMGVAFATTKAYNRRSRAIAKAKGKAQARLSKTYGKDSLNYGKNRSFGNIGREKQFAWRGASMTNPDSRQYLTIIR